MPSVSAGDRRLLLRTIEASYSCTDRERFIDQILRALSRLVPGEFAYFGELDFSGPTTFDRTYPAVFFKPEYLPLWHQATRVHPGLQFLLRTGDASAHTISDFISEQAFHRNPVARPILETLGVVEDALAFGLEVKPPRMVVAAVNRDIRSFSSRDRLVFNMLQPHLAQAWHNLRVLEQLSEQERKLGWALDALGCGVVGLDHGGHTRLLTPRARAVLTSYFHGWTSLGEQLPPVLREWLRHLEACDTSTGLPHVLEPMVVDRGDHRLVVRLLLTPNGRLLLLQEIPKILATSAARVLRLTPREAEVLSWVAEGKTNSEIAVILHMSAPTVKRHVEDILGKLEVESRTAAAVLALRAMFTHPS